MLCNSAMIVKSWVWNSLLLLWVCLLSPTAFVVARCFSGQTMLELSEAQPQGEQGVRVSFAPFCVLFLFFSFPLWVLIAICPSVRTWDHTCVIHSLWLFAAQLKCRLQVERVPTKANIADAPSRQDYSLLRSLGAQEVKATFHQSFLHAGAWRALQLKGAFF